MRHLLVILALGLILHVSPAVAETVEGVSRGSNTGLPLPRFVSLKSGKANLRTGPGRAYPIRWVYHRRFLPVQITDEYGHWRAVRDPWGETGWLHKSLLSGRRTAMVMQNLAPLMREARTDSDILLYAERRVIGTLERCQADWCRLSIEGRAGWMPVEILYGGTPASEGKKVSAR
ncbi:SH3 domain-containing protein [Minwuia sp.]|uniref:SH3 domain-containing protein n=1 Tax=Minwuia sp. TaxID=2493630 RepID=UPI003A954DF8